MSINEAFRQQRVSEYAASQADAVCEAAKIIQGFLDRPSDDWEDAKEVPHPVLRVAVMTPLDLLEREARDWMRKHG